MSQLRKYFFNPFFDKHITYPRLLSFSLFHLSKLSANNAGNIYGTIISATQPASGALGDALDADMVKEDRSMAATKGKKKARKTMQKFISNNEGVIKSTFSRDSASYKKFFPRGLKDFHSATDEKFVTKINVFLKMSQIHQADLGNNFITAVSSAIGVYANAMGLRITESGQIAPAKAGVKNAARALAQQLMVNIHTIGINNPGADPDELVQIFFNEKLLYAAHRQQIFHSRPAPHSTEPVCTFAFKAGKSFRIKNKGAKPLSFQFGVHGTAVGNVFTVEPGAELTKSFTDFYSLGDTLFVINNEDTAGYCQVNEVA